MISGYLSVLKARELLALQQEYLELSRLNYENAERMHAGGRYSKAEALRWKVEYQQQKSLVVSAENTLRTAQIELGRLLNLQNARLSEVNAEYDFISSMVNLYHLLGKVESLVEPTN